MTEVSFYCPDPEAPELATVDVLTVLQALSDPVRLEIVRQLAGSDETGLMCGQIVLRVSKSTGSHHLKTLHLQASPPSGSRACASTSRSAVPSSTRVSRGCSTRC